VSNSFYPTELNKSEKGISLQDLTNRIKRVLALNFSSAVWVRAEIASLKISNGHRYLDLVQKENETDAVLARVQANLWAGNYLLLKKQLEEDIELIVKEGQEILIEVKVNFHPQYGLSLQIVNVDPDFTIGKYFTKKQQLFARLLKEKLNEPQKSLKIPLVLQRIAVISSSRAAGYLDFIKQLESVSHRMQIKTELMKSSMQGASVETDIIRNLESILNSPEKFDLVVIIRGGGAKLDLMDFDSYPIAKTIAHYPIPVLTGIGHEIDISALDVVAAIHQKTPTAAAQYIINKNDEFIGRIELAKIKITEAAVNQLNQHKTIVERIRTEVINQSKVLLLGKRHQMNRMRGELILQSRFQFQKTAERFHQLSRELKISDPANIMKRGFSICSIDGKIVQTTKQLKSGDQLTLKLFEGKAESTITKIYQNE